MNEPDMSEVLSTITGLGGVLIAAYGFITEGPQKLIAMIIGLLIISLYTQWFIRKHITSNIKNVEHAVDVKMERLNEKIEGIKNEISYIRGYLHRPPKGKKAAIDPIWLITILVIVIIIILYYQGKL